MRASQTPLAGGDPGIIADAGIGIIAAGLTAVAAWGPPPSLIGTPIPGPSWLLALLPLLHGRAAGAAPPRAAADVDRDLGGHSAAIPARRTTRCGAWRSRSCCSPPPTHWARTPACAARSPGCLIAPVVAEISRQGRAGAGLLARRARRPGGRGIVVRCSSLAFWLAGVLVRTRRRAAWLAARSAALQLKAEQATAAERARIARELHDIVAHHLSVIVLQAAGARASGKPAGATPGEDREQRTAGAGRDPPHAGRAARPGRGDRARPAAGHRRPGRAGRQRPGSRPAGEPGHRLRTAPRCPRPWTYRSTASSRRR